jgi:hypothetical protein
VGLLERGNIIRAVDHAGRASHMIVSGNRVDAISSHRRTLLPKYGYVFFKCYCGFSETPVVSAASVGGRP